MRALAHQLARLLRGQQGFGLVELMVSLTVLVVGILATFGAFEASLLHLHRASTVTTASAVGEQEIESYRALRYDRVALDQASLLAAAADTTYTSDPACAGVCTAAGAAAGQSVAVASGGSPAITTRSGADGKSYRVDTYVTWQPVAGGRTVKKVTVVVRDRVTRKAWARIVSSFDLSTGQ